MRGLCRKHYQHFLDDRRARGEYISGLVDPARARAHVEALRAMGLSYKRIGQLGGFHGSAMRDALARCNKITAQREAQVLAVPIPTAPHRLASSGRKIPSCGTVRRLQALVAFGYNARQLCHKLGIAAETNLVGLVTGSQAEVTAERARQVEAMYDAMSTAPGMCPRAIRRAQRNKWAPPMAWEGIDIDDPASEPAPWLPVDTGRNLPADWLDMLLDWRRLGRTDEAIAEALGIEVESMMRRLDRAGIDRGYGCPLPPESSAVRYGVLVRASRSR